MPLEDEEFKRLFEEGDAAYRRSREALKNNPHRPTPWEDITPPQLKPAIEYLRKEFATSRWRLSMKVECGCYLGLHPQLSLQPKFQGGLENLVPLNMRSEWQKKYAGVRESETFKFWSDEFSEELAKLIVVPFDAFLKIGLAQKSVLKLPPIEWAQALTDDLIYALEWTLPRLIKDMCDKQENRRDITDEGFLGDCAWVYWRAPKLVHMQPLGNIAFDPATAWARENVEDTEDLLKSLSGRMLDSARARLTKLTGDAHVSLASTPPLPTPPTEGQGRGPEPHMGRSEQLADQITSTNLPRTLKQPEPPEDQESRPDQVPGRAAQDRPSLKADGKLDYRSPIKRAILIQLIRNHRASDLAICRGLDDDGAVELPSAWAVGRNRSFESVYKTAALRPRIEATISKVRADIRKHLRKPIP